MSTQVWFQGTISEAVQLVNTRNCLFVVFIHDDTEPSNQLNELLNDTKLQDTLQKLVSIKLNLDSENARMFGQFYPIQRVPMVYFIKQGVIKDFAIETTPVEEILKKVDQLEQTNMASSTLPPSSIPTETNTSPTDPLPNLNSFASNPTTDSTTTQSTDSSSSSDRLDKKQKLKQQMEQARARRDEIEKENEKQREMKRRQDGKEAQLTQQQLQDQQNKVYFAKIKKEKQADEEHRRKIKEQIARDREEKMAERQRRVQQQQQQQQQETMQVSSPSQQPRQNKEIRQHDVCHLNVRQGDGNNIRNTFNANDKLEDVRSWIDENRTDGDQPYKLLAQFPTRHFSTGDEQKTLYALGLVPSSTVIMKPIRNVASAYQSPSGSSASYSGIMVDYIYSAGGMVYNIFTGVAGALGNMMGAVGPAGGSDGHRLGGPQPQAPSSGSRQIHTLQQQDQTDDDDRKKTYNGNSVNQE